MKYKHLAMIMGVMITATSVGSTATAFAADSKTAVMAGGYGSAAAVQGRNFLRHKQGSACC